MRSIASYLGVPSYTSLTANAAIMENIRFNLSCFRDVLIEPNGHFEGCSFVAVELYCFILRDVSNMLSTQINIKKIGQNIRMTSYHNTAF